LSAIISRRAILGIRLARCAGWSSEASHCCLFAENAAAAPLAVLHCQDVLAFHFFNYVSTEDTKVGHRDFILAQQISKPLSQSRFGPRIMMATPLPEELLDLRYVAPAGDVFHTLVVDR